MGFYDERLRRTEDNDMHYRMRKAGYRFYFSPDIVSWHAARKTLRGQLSQKWGNGYWIGRTMRIQPRCFAPRLLSLIHIWRRKNTLPHFHESR